MAKSEDIVKNILVKEKHIKEYKGETQLNEKEIRQEMDMDNKQNDRSWTEKK